MPNYDWSVDVCSSDLNKEKAKDKGGWVETGDPARHIDPLLDVWQPPKELKAGAHAKHLRNLYVFFWRWASWKVWDHGPGDKTGIVCFISVSGFLNGPGFQQMRAWLRDTVRSEERSVGKECVRPGN